MIERLKNSPIFTHTQDIVDLCKPLALFDITTFVNARITKNGELSSLSNHPDFVRNYVEKGYQNADIHVRRDHTNIGNCLMWDAMECYGETEQMIADAAALNNRHIFTVVKTSETHTDFYHFGTHLNKPSINQWYINHLDLLHHFINFFAEKIVQSPKLAMGHNFTVPTVKQHEQCQIKSIIKSENLDVTRQFLNMLGVKDGDQISPKQLECVKLLAQGLSAKEIARKVNLSHRTVEDYLAALRNKLKVKNSVELIARILKNTL
jgi:DNA-binding CsgD family transcriptional regulator